MLIYVLEYIYIAFIYIYCVVFKYFVLI